MRVDMDDFIVKFCELFDEELNQEIFGSTVFKDLPQWDSLVALSFIVMASNVYQKSIDGEAIRSANTVSDLFELVK
jgi:acyl carrier protein